MQPVPFTNGFYVSDSLPLSAQECTNWYPSPVEVPAMSTEILRGTPGTIQRAISGDAEHINRGGRAFKDAAYFVNGTVLYRLNRAVDGDGVVTYSLTSLGTIPGTGRVSMSDNGTQLLILVPGDPSAGYVFTTSPDTLTEITDLDFKASGEPQQVVYIDGYFVFTTDTKKFICSELNDGLAYNALDFGSAEADPDATVAPVVLNNQLFIGGSQTIEAFQNVGGEGFPFQRTGLYVPKGFSAPFAVLEAGDSFVFVGAGRREGPAVYKLSGNQAEKISTIPIDYLLQNLTSEELADIFMWSYGQMGAFFVAIALPTTTIVIDLATGKWHERKSQYPDGKGVTTTNRCRVNSVVSAYGQILVGDAVDGRIGAMSLDYYMEYDNPIVRRVATQPFVNEMESFLVPTIELTMESGVGTAEVQDPKIRMDRSLDGKTWKDDRSRPIGKKGEHKRRSIWRRNGRAERFEIFRFTMSDAVKPVILQLSADIV